MQIHDTAFIAPGAVVLGDVTIGENSGIWYNAVVRGDRDSIVIGRESNIQDNAVVHLGSGYPVEIGDHVTIGHGAIIHGCKIGDNTMIGMGALLSDFCYHEKNRGQPELSRTCFQRRLSLCQHAEKADHGRGNCTEQYGGDR